MSWARRAWLGLSLCAGAGAAAHADDEAAEHAPAPDPPPATDAAAAAEPPPAALPAPAPTELPPIEVTVRRPPPERAQAGSDYVIPVGQLAAVPRRSAEALLTLAPGLLTTNHGGQFHASAFFLRGFDAGEGQDLEFSVDGLPVNEPSNPHAHGYADMHFVIARLVSELRVTEGPFDPRQGDFAVAGSARYTLGLPERGVHATAGYGSWDRRQLTLLWGPRDAGPGSFAGVEVEQGDGFGRNRAFAAARALARHELRLSDGTRLSGLVTSYGSRFDAAGVIRRDDYLARRLPCPAGRDPQFFCTYDPNQGGAGTRHAAVVNATREDDGTLASLTGFAMLRTQRLRQNLTGYVTDVSSMGLPQRGDGTEQRYDATTVGARGSLRFAPARRGGWWRLVELGFLARHDDAVATVRRLRTVGGAPYRVDADDALQVTNLGVYLAARVQPLPRLYLQGGVRADSFLFSVTDRNRPASDRTGSRLTSETQEAYGLVAQPRLSLDAALGGGLRWTAAAGAGARSSQAQALSAGERAPFARVVATEAGPVWTRAWADAASADLRLLAYHTHVDRDLLFDERAGRNIPVGASNRFGALASGRLVLPPSWDVLGSLTYAEAYLPPERRQGWALARGVRMPYVPRWVARLDAAWRRELTVGGQPLTAGSALGVTYVAPRPLPFEQLSPALATVDVAARLGYRGWQLGLEVTNLFDRRNREAVFNYASNFRGPDEPPSLLPQQHFSAGQPRAFLLTLSTQVTP